MPRANVGIQIVLIIGISMVLWASVYAVNITNVMWDEYWNIIRVTIDEWPGHWPDWTMYVDGVAMPVQEEGRELYVYPTAPVETNPTELAIGTRESAECSSTEGLTNIDFPCCGTLQFYIPEVGYTNIYEYNVKDFGCLTASSKECPEGEWTVHEGDLHVYGVYTIEDEKFFLKDGSVYVYDGGRLEITNSEFMMGRGTTSTIHMYFFIDPGATLIVDNSKIYAQPGTGLVCVINKGYVEMTDSETEIHYFDVSGDAEFVMTRSSMVNEIGGLLQVRGGTTVVTDSTIGALGLDVPAGAHVNIAGLESGAYFESWSVQEWIPDAGYSLTLERTTVLPDDLTGEHEHGPYERGWIFILHKDSHARISDAHLRKVFVDVENDTATFQNLLVDTPSSLQYGDILLTDIFVRGEWGFTITDSEVEFNNCNYLFLQPSRGSTVTVRNSHMVEFIPRHFQGRMIFENALWTNAGEIVVAPGYQESSYDRFRIEGSIRFGPELREHLQWSGAVVYREFDFLITDVLGQPVPSVEIRTKDLWLDENEGTFVTDENGEARFTITFCQANYKCDDLAAPVPGDPTGETPLIFEVWRGGECIQRAPLEFFTETPILVTELDPSTAAIFRITREGHVLSDGDFYGAGFESGSADVAEWVPVSEPVEPGDVLEIDPENPGHYRKARGPCSQLVAGVVSTEPGFVLAHGGDTEDKALLALMGIVPVKVTDEGGPIQPGDLLVVSSTPGYAMRWDPDSGIPCALVGKALEPFERWHGMVLALLIGG